jgi:hypothetical protein
VLELPKGPRIVTSYLAHPLFREKRKGVLRVPVCRQLRFYAASKDAYWRDLVPSWAAVRAGKRGDFEPYRRELDIWTVWGVRTYLEYSEGVSLVVLLCWEADPLKCHRRLTFEALAGRPWTPEDEVKSPHGGLAEVDRAE